MSIKSLLGPLQALSQPGSPLQLETPLIRAVFFDAVGTLLHCEPAFHEVYWRIGQRFGSRLTKDEVKRRFREAFEKQDNLDRERNWRTDEQREYRRWQEIVATVLDDVSKPAEVFEILYEHFGRGSGWRVTEGAAQVLQSLAGRGLVVGMASNLDKRLHRVVDELPELKALQKVVVSSEVGWRKPATKFFQEVVRVAGVRADEILFVGDDLHNDVEGAERAGMIAAWLQPGQSLTAAYGLAFAEN